MQNKQQDNICNNVMDCIKERNLSPRPRWYYFASGVLWFVGLTALFMHASLLLHRMAYFAVDQGPLLTDMERKWKMLFIVISIPAAAWSFFMGTQMVRRYGVFYKYHPYVMLGALLIISAVAVLVIEYTPLRNMII